MVRGGSYYTLYVVPADEQYKRLPVFILNSDSPFIGPMEDESMRSNELTKTSISPWV